MNAPSQHPTNLLSRFSAYLDSEGGSLDPELLKRLDEYGQAIAQGQPVDKSELLAAYPELSGQLDAYLSALEFVNAVFHEESSSVAETQDDVEQTGSLPRRTLGEFVLLSERGRGGMGVVYEAEQPSLHRRVALKVLLGTAGLTPQQLQRFKNESQAAASLDHPHIVKIYSVGCERGVHYYAMQYVDGHDLAQWIQTQQQEQAGKGNGPSVDFVARLAMQAAEALEHAHQMGIIHRDIKPSNLLLDASGHLWVTDFGLALTHTGVKMTMTGDILGTLRYMSPEQAAGRHELLSGASDIYSLGSTLYELLTLRPPFPEEDRHVLLRQLAEQDPPPLRRWRPDVPRDLETIVMKCLAKEPHARYLSAQALADDLQRFQESKPILAQRPSIPSRLSKWSRRHRSVVYGAAGLAAIVFVGMIVANRWMAEQRNIAREAAEGERKMAALAEHERQTAEQERRVAELERQRAESNFRKAKEAVDRGIRHAAEEMANQPQMEKVRRALLEDALAFYQGFLSQKTDDPEINQETAAAYYQVGYINLLLGQYQKCIEPLERACQLLEALKSKEPQQLECRLQLAKSYDQLAYTLMWVRRLDEAVAYRRKQLAVRSEIRKDFSDKLEYWRLEAFAYSDLGVMLREAGKLGDAIRQFHQAQAVSEEERKAFPDASPDLRVLGHIQHWWGATLESSFHWEEAEKHYREANKLLGEWLTQSPQDAFRQHTVAHIKVYLSSLLLTVGKNSEEVGVLLQEAVRLDDECIRTFPNTADYRRRAAIDYRLWGNYLASKNRNDEAEAAYRRAVGIAADTVANSPGIPVHIALLAWARYELAWFLDTHGRSKEAVEIFQTVLKEVEAAAKEYPNNVDCVGFLALFLVDCPEAQFHDAKRSVELAKQVTQIQRFNPLNWEVLGMGQYLAGNAKEALASLKTAAQLSKGGSARLWLCLAIVHWQLGEQKEAMTWHRKAVAWIDEKHPIEVRLAPLLKMFEELRGK